MRVFAFAILTCLLLAGCFDGESKKDLKTGQQNLEAGDIKNAEFHFKRAFERSSNRQFVLAAAERLHEIAFLHTRDYKTAIRYLDVMIGNEDNFAISFEALKKKAFIQHKYLGKFEDAIATYHRILASSSLSVEEENETRRNLVKCLLAINNFTQARTELLQLKEEKQNLETRISAQLMEATSFQSEGQIEKAIETYQELLKTARNETQRKEALINLALCFEHKEQYKEALGAIEQIATNDTVLSEKRLQLEKLVRFQGRRLKR